MLFGFMLFPISQLSFLILMSYVLFSSGCFYMEPSAPWFVLVFLVFLCLRFISLSWWHLWWMFLFKFGIFLANTCSNIFICFLHLFQSFWGFKYFKYFCVEMLVPGPKVIEALCISFFFLFLFCLCNFLKLYFLFVFQFG